MKKTILWFEIILCFGPVLPFFLIGLTFVPLQVYAIVGNKALHWEGPLLLIAMVAGGAIGLVTLCYLVTRLMKRGDAIDRPYLVIAGAVVGIASGLPASAVAGRLSTLALLVLPLIGTVHRKGSRCRTWIIGLCFDGCERACRALRGRDRGSGLLR